MLSTPKRLAWTSALLVLGLLPSLLFFIWIERNCSLPFLPVELEWPWVSWLHMPLGFRAAWNVSLFLLFGVFHSVLAQKKTKFILARWIPPQALRAFYVIFSGLTIFLLMALWQPLGVLLWVAPFSWAANVLISVIVYWSLMLVAALSVGRLDGLGFMGIKQLGLPAGQIDPHGEVAGNHHRLITSGWYRRVRHPLYLFMLLAIFITPVMPLDRVVLGLAFLIYLAFAVPVEEKKLVERFGAEYREYQKKVPAVVPFSLARSQKS